MIHKVKESLIFQDLSTVPENKTGIVGINLHIEYLYVPTRTYSNIIIMNPSRLNIIHLSTSSKTN